MYNVLAKKREKVETSVMRCETKYENTVNI